MSDHTKAACLGASTREVRSCGATFEECRLCGTRVRWDLVGHRFFGFHNCERAARLRADAPAPTQEPK